MEKHILYYTPLCADTPAFRQALDSVGIAYEAIDITESIANLKQFIRLRDDNPAFDDAKRWGFVGVPVLVTKQKQFFFDVNEILGTTCSPRSIEE